MKMVLNPFYKRDFELAKFDPDKGYVFMVDLADLSPIENLCFDYLTFVPIDKQGCKEVQIHYNIEREGAALIYFLDAANNRTVIFRTLDEDRLFCVFVLWLKRKKGLICNRT